MKFIKSIEEHNRLINKKNNIKNGWCDDNKAITLAEVAYLIQKNQGSVCVVEIGVFAGKSLYCITEFLEKNSKMSVFGVDPFNSIECCKGENSEENDKWWSSINWDIIIKSAEDVASKNNCILLKETSEEATRHFDDNTVDFVHQDGNHSELMSCLDIDLWCNKLRSGGYWLMDDTNWETTKKAQKLIIEKGFIDVSPLNCDVIGREWRLFKKC